jgi:hypothetical protein
LVVPEKSPLAGKSLSQSDFRKAMGLTVLRLRQAKEPQRSFVPVPGTILEEGDRLVVEGNIEQLLKSKETGPLKIYAETKFDDASLIGEGRATRRSGSRAQRHPVRQLDQSGAPPAPLQCAGAGLASTGPGHARRFTSVPLAVGDVLLVQGSPEAVSEMARSHGFPGRERLEHAPAT